MAALAMGQFPATLDFSDRAVDYQELPVTKVWIEPLLALDHHRKEFRSGAFFARWFLFDNNRILRKDRLQLRHHSVTANLIYIHCEKLSAVRILLTRDPFSRHDHATQSGIQRTQRQRC